MGTTGLSWYTSRQPIPTKLFCVKKQHSPSSSWIIIIIIVDILFFTHYDYSGLSGKNSGLQKKSLISLAQRCCGKDIVLFGFWIQSTLLESSLSQTPKQYNFYNWKLWLYWGHCPSLPPLTPMTQLPCISVWSGVASKVSPWKRWQRRRCIEQILILLGYSLWSFKEDKWIFN